MEKDSLPRLWLFFHCCDFYNSLQNDSTSLQNLTSGGRDFFVDIKECFGRKKEEEEEIECLLVKGIITRMRIQATEWERSHENGTSGEELLPKSGLGHTLVIPETWQAGAGGSQIQDQLSVT